MKHALNDKQGDCLIEDHGRAHEHMYKKRERWVMDDKKHCVQRNKKSKRAFETLHYDKSLDTDATPLRLHTFEIIPFCK